MHDCINSSILPNVNDITRRGRKQSSLSFLKYRLRSVSADIEKEVLDIGNINYLWYQYHDIKNHFLNVKIGSLIQFSRVEKASFW